jgi:hypothetical protein
MRRLVPTKRSPIRCHSTWNGSGKGVLPARVVSAAGTKRYRRGSTLSLRISKLASALARGAVTVQLAVDELALATGAIVQGLGTRAVQLAVDELALETGGVGPLAASRPAPSRRPRTITGPARLAAI